MIDFKGTRASSEPDVGFEKRNASILREMSTFLRIGELTDIECSVYRDCESLLPSSTPNFCFLLGALDPFAVDELASPISSSGRLRFPAVPLLDSDNLN